jgi:hypothetical protein
MQNFKITLPVELCHGDLDDSQMVSMRCFACGIHLMAASFMYRWASMQHNVEKPQDYELLHLEFSNPQNKEK